MKITFSKDAEWDNGGHAHVIGLLQGLCVDVIKDGKVIEAAVVIIGSDEDDGITIAPHQTDHDNSTHFVLDWSKFDELRYC